MRKMKKIGIVLALLAIALGAWWALFVWRDSPRGKLPWSARNIQVYSKSYGVQGWTYYLKAELPEEDFQKFASRLRATHYDDTPELKASDGHDVQWAHGPASWWDPTPVKTNTYGRSNGMGLDILKWENGHVYFQSTGS